VGGSGRKRGIQVMEAVGTKEVPIWVFIPFVGDNFKLLHYHPKKE